MENQQINEVRKLIEGAELNLQQAHRILNRITGADNFIGQKARRSGNQTENDTGQVVEGVFDGQQMVGPDGRRYAVPANYASKSKLVEGDMMKLTIDGNGSFVYKQIGPLQRTRLKGTLTQDEQTGEWKVLADGKPYKVLLASVTFFKGNVGDETIILVPESRESEWAAVENIVKRGEIGGPSDKPETNLFRPAATHEAQPTEKTTAEILPAQAMAGDDLQPLTDDNNFETI